MFAIAALLGCENDTPSGPATPQDKAITFGNVTTRAVTSAADINEFPVWACIAGPEGYVSLLDGERVYRTTDGAWDYDNTRYWVDDSHFFFLGLYSDEAIGSFVENKFEGLANIVYTLDVETPSTADLDIVTAFNYVDTSDEIFKTALTDPDIAAPMVNMQFGHLMTKVNLKVQQDFDKDPDFDYYVTKVTLTGVKNSGMYIFVPTEEQSPYYVSAWNFEKATTTTFEKSFAEPCILRNTGAADRTVTISVWGNDGLLLIPQEIAANAVKIRVDYLYDITPGDGDPGTTSHFIEGYLPASTDLWQSGKSINYTLKVAEQNDITFGVPTIEPWGAPQTGGTIIIK